MDKTDFDALREKYGIGIAVAIFDILPEPEENLTLEELGSIRDHSINIDLNKKVNDLMLKKAESFDDLMYILKYFPYKEEVHEIFRRLFAVAKTAMDFCRLCTNPEYCRLPEKLRTDIYDRLSTRIADANFDELLACYPVIGGFSGYYQSMEPHARKMARTFDEFLRIDEVMKTRFTAEELYKRATNFEQAVIAFKACRRHSDERNLIEGSLERLRVFAGQPL